MDSDAEIFPYILWKGKREEESQKLLMNSQDCIINNVRLNLDMLDYNVYIIEGSFVLFVNFCKALDTVSLQFTTKTKQTFGYGKWFICIFIYNSCSRSIKLPYGMLLIFFLEEKNKAAESVHMFLFCLQYKWWPLKFKWHIFKVLKLWTKNLKDHS